MTAHPHGKAIAAVALMLLAGCGDSSGPGGVRATLSGTVRSTGSSTVLEGATVSIGTRQTTSDAGGRYELTDLPAGAARVRAERAGYVSAEATVTISPGANSHDVGLTVQEIYVSGAEAVYVPGEVGPLRGVIIVLGGPVTSGFVTGGQIAPPGSTELERSLQELGASLRALARSARVALLGSATTGMASSAASDAALFTALRDVAAASGHPEVADAPVLMFGLSAGSREAAGLVSRNPERAIGLLVRVPVSVTNLTAAAALAVPTFVMQAELDHVVDNATVRATFAENRSRGGLWALAVELNVGHDVATNLGNQVAIGWISTALTRRIPGTSGDLLIALDPASGWLGNQTTFAIASWADYAEDRTTASWLLSPETASSWQLLGTFGGEPEPLESSAAFAPDLGHTPRPIPEHRLNLPKPCPAILRGPIVQYHRCGPLPPKLHIAQLEHDSKIREPDEVAKPRVVRAPGTGCPGLHDVGELHDSQLMPS